MPLVSAGLHEHGRERSGVALHRQPQRMRIPLRPRPLARIARCGRECDAGCVASRVHAASMLIGFRGFRSHGFTAYPAHLGGSHQKHERGLFTPQRPSDCVRRGGSCFGIGTKLTGSRSHVKRQNAPAFFHALQCQLAYDWHERNNDLPNGMSHRNVLRLQFCGTGLCPLQTV